MANLRGTLTPVHRNAGRMTTVSRLASRSIDSALNTWATQVLTVLNEDGSGYIHVRDYKTGAVMAQLSFGPEAHETKGRFSYQLLTGEDK